MVNSSHSSAPSKKKKDSAPLSDEDLQKKKKQNAIAQATSRTRQAAYVSTLEETVTNLEQVVLQLQDSVREHEGLQARLQQENLRLEHDLTNFKQHCTNLDGFWRSQCMQGGTTEGLSLPLLGSYLSSPSVEHQHHPFSTNESYSNHEANTPYLASFSIARPSVYSSPSYHHAQSAARCEENQRTSPLATSGGTQYMHPAIHSPLSAPPSAVVLDGLHQHPVGYEAELAVPYGGMANIVNTSVAVHSDNEIRSLLPLTRREFAPERVVIPAVSRGSEVEAVTSVVGSSGDAGVGYMVGTSEHFDCDRGIQRSPRSPSPSLVWDTLAVIQRQAFGTLRQTRGRKKGEDDVARMSKEALEARGIPLSIATAGGLKRRRTSYEEDHPS